MKYDKSILRKKYILKRKNSYLKKKRINFNFNLIFKLIEKNFKKKK